MTSNFHQRCLRVVADLTYRDWRFRLSPDEGDPWLQVTFHDEKGDFWTGRKWRLSAHMTDSEVVQTALKAVLTAEEHEARERFTYRGRAIFGPHISVDTLWEVCLEQEKRK
jgi:hypothetical protein